MSKCCSCRLLADLIFKEHSSEELLKIAREECVRWVKGKGYQGYKGDNPKSASIWIADYDLNYK